MVGDHSGGATTVKQEMKRRETKSENRKVKPDLPNQPTNCSF